MLEQARPDLFPAGAILLPLVITGIVWSGTASSVFSGGLVLILDWIVRPHGMPLLPVGITLAATVLLASRSAHNPWTGTRRRLRIPEESFPTVLVLIGIGLLIGPAMLARQTSTSEALSALRMYLVVSLPLVLLLTGLLKVAGEFGWRRLT